ncbi:alpha-ketoglutarate-dependent dioxygenase alkB homolog 6 [Striga asiatica]|uniref:Alpha-ketoglutarate-dependent dioxygenase alkB homolog 6 n=1 Tax=Striga asiatica TaxID=4170 RepID=A0A5A7R004_STRAF|nr:alpha-ketoglutarate-dependent dioxygenase alkB homolog 6 [Striga asiatica]
MNNRMEEILTGEKSNISNEFVVGSVPTVFYIPEYVTAAEEEQLLNNIYQAPVSKWKSLMNRRLQNWGGVVHEKGLLAQQLPHWLTKVTSRIFEESKLFPSAINHVLINEYLPHQGIMVMLYIGNVLFVSIILSDLVEMDSSIFMPHQDGPAYVPVVAILSLGSPAVMNFVPHPRFEKAAQNNSEDIIISDDVPMDISSGERLSEYVPFSVVLMPRSLLIFKDNAYSDYLHGIKDSVEHQCDEAVNITTLKKCDDLACTHTSSINDGEARGEAVIHRTGTRVSLTCRVVTKLTSAWKCLGIGSRQWEIVHNSTELLSGRKIVFIPKRPGRGQHAHIQLLAQVSPLPHLRPQVPKPRIVERRHHSCPRVRVHLDRVPAHGIQQVVVLPLLWAPLPWLDSHGEERVPVQVPRLDASLTVLKDYLDKVPECSVHHARRHHQLLRSLARVVLHEPVLEHLVGHSEVLRQLERRLGVDVGNPVDPEPELPADCRPRVGDFNSPGDVDLPVVVRALRIGTGGAGRQVPPERPELVHGPRDALPLALGRRRRELGGRRGRGPGVPDDGHGAERLLQEAAGDDEVVVADGLVGGDEDGQALSDVEVERVVNVLHSVRPFHLDQGHRVALEAEVDRDVHPGVADAEAVGFSRLERREGLGDYVADLVRLAVDVDAVRAADGASGVEDGFEGLVALVVPVAEDDGELVGRAVEGDGDEVAAVDLEDADAAGRALEAGGGEVEVAADLVLHLCQNVGKNISCVVGAGEDGAHGAGGAVLPRVLALLNAGPCEEEGLVEMVEHVHDDVVVGGAVDLRARELAVDEDALLGDAERGDGAVGHFPFVEKVRVLGGDAGGQADEDGYRDEALATTHDKHFD